MIIDNETSDLLSFALLQLDPRAVNKRVAMNLTLLEISLYNTGRACSVKQLCNAVDKLIDQNNFISDQEASQLLTQGANIGSIIPKGENYELSDTRKKQFQSAEAEIETLNRIVRKELIENIELEIEKVIENEMQIELLDEIFRIITENIYSNALQIARENVQIDRVALNSDVDDPLESLNKIIERYFGANRPLIIAQIKNAILNYFQKFSDELASLLKYIHHNVLVNQILNVDPVIVERQKHLFAERRIYLDTNVVLAYIFQGQKNHTVVREIVEASKALGTQFFISPFTLDELNRQVDRAKRHYPLYERNPLVMQQAEFIDDAILKTFVQLKRTQPALDWDAYIAPFNDIENALLDYDILLEDEGAEDVIKHPKYQEISKSIGECKPISGKNVIEHDTNNFCLINALQNKYKADERGQTVWLLTIDRSLKKAQRILYGAKDISRPFSLQAKDWGEIVVPLQSVSSFAFDDFIGYLAKMKLGVLIHPQIVQLDFLETITNAEVDVDRLLGLHPEQARAAIIALQENREVNAILKNVQQTEELKEKQELQEKFSNMLATAIEDTDAYKKLQSDYEKRIDILQEELSEKERQIGLQNTRLSHMEERLDSIERSWIYKLIKTFRKSD